MTPTNPDATLLADPHGEFRRCYNRTSFLFAHGLAGDPIFELSALIALSERLPDHPHFTYWSNGPVEVEDRWEKGSRQRASLQQTIREIEHNNSLVILKHVEQDPVYAPVLQRLLGRIVDLSGPEMREDVRVGEVLVLISSPNRVTSYHIDAETNYLMQVTGDKTAYVFPHDRPEVMSDVELERFHAGDFNGAVYKAATQDHAVCYDLKAGHGIHIPPHAPHWVRNGDNLSVALSVNFELKSIAQLAMVYRFNRWLRSAGLSPRSPDLRQGRDRAKGAFARAALGAKGLLRPRERVPAVATWSP